jgi:hypothetical protein
VLQLISPSDDAVVFSSDHSDQTTSESDSDSDSLPNLTKKHGIALSDNFGRRMSHDASDGFLHLVPP